MTVAISLALISANFVILFPLYHILAHLSTPTRVPQFLQMPVMASTRFGSENQPLWSLAAHTAVQHHALSASTSCALAEQNPLIPPTRHHDKYPSSLRDKQSTTRQCALLNLARLAILSHMNLNRVLRNTLALFTGQSGAQIIAFIFVAWLVKIVGDEQYGRLAFAFRYTVVLNVFTEFGLWTLLVRNVARDPDAAPTLFWNSLVLKFILSVLTALAGWCVLVLLYDPRLHPPAYFALAWVLFYAWYFSIAALFRAFHEHHWDGLLAFSGKLLYAAVGLTILQFTHDVRWIALVFSSSMALQCLAALLILLHRHPSLRFSVSLSGMWDLLRHARLFFIINLFTTLHLNFAHLLVARYCSERSLAYYNAAAMLVLVPIVLANAFVQSMYPVLSASYERHHKDFWPTVSLALRWLAALAFPVILYMTLDSHRLMTSIFRKEFAAGVVPLQILLWGLGLDFFNPFTGHVLYVLNMQRRVMWITGASVFANIGANFFLVPRFGIVGASCAMLISLSVMFWGYALSLRAWLSLSSLARSMLPPFFVALALAPGAWLLRQHMPFYILGPLYCVTCALAFFALRLLRVSHLRMFTLDHQPSADELRHSEPDPITE